MRSSLASQLYFERLETEWYELSLVIIALSFSRAETVVYFEQKNGLFLR